MRFSGYKARDFASFALCLSALAACSYPARLPPPEARPRPTAQGSSSTADDGLPTSAASLPDRVVELALASIGRPYKWGGTDSNGFDCSGLIQFAYGEYGVRLPRVSSAQIHAGDPVEPSSHVLQPGDVLGFSQEANGATSHVGLYVGDGQFIHSSSTGVRISNLEDTYWKVRLVAARRIVE